jgi:hypothetical protein
MSENKSRRVGVINFVGKIDIPAEAITVAVKANIAEVGRHILVNLKALKDFSIPPSALVSVEVKDNVLNEPNTFDFGRWSEVDRSLTLRVKIGNDFYARRTSICVMFVDPSNGTILAASPLLHAADDTGELQNTGESYIKFRRDVTQTLPAKALLDIEGPVIEFGATGPVDVAASESDPAFVHYALPNAIGFFVSKLLLAEDGYDTVRWNKFKADAADWAGFDGWASLRKAYDTADKPEVEAAKITNKAMSGLMNARAFKDRLKRLLAQTKQTDLIEEYKDAA